MRKLKDILLLIRPYWGKALANAGLNLLAALFSVFSLTMVIPFLQVLFRQDNPVPELPELTLNKDSLLACVDYIIAITIRDQGKFMTLFLLCLFVVVMFLLKNLFSYLALYVLTPVRTGMVRDLRNKLYDRLLILPLSYYNEKKRGDLISRATNDIQEVESSVIRSFELFFREPLTILLFLLALFTISSYLTLFVLLLLPLAGLVIGRIARKLRRRSAEAQQRMGNMLSVVEETISGLRILKAFNALDLADRKFREMNSDYTRLMTGISRKGDLSSPLSEFLGVIILMVILLFGGYLVLNNSIALSAEAFIGFIVIFSQLINPAKNISTAWAQVQRGLSSFERIRQVLDAEEVITEKPDAIRIKSFQESIIYRDVCFAYESEHVLKDINLVISKGKRLAVVGASGSGKSTLADLLPRFYDPTQGQILLDGIPLTDYHIGDLRSLFGIVTQEPVLFNDSIRNNIAFGWEAADMDTIRQAAVIANADGFIEALPEAYDTFIGDRGSKLSGGQRQRISIARAILRNPPFLILDEATSSLDSESEKQVSLALDQAMSGRTTLVIAHRLSTVMHADHIIVLDQGRIAESGTHTSLMKLETGIYRKLFEMQGR
ncbi:MAG TPA: ABC transporter ATP-binding protein [Bacteroidales bacterium]|nr:ABC transporter ATP-binding protein [Bacteroidales bacterium]HSA43303.1 ABC transporter ATP-binding protein [Bacteroidales bacterium]